MKDGYHLAGALGRDHEMSKISLGIYGHKPGVFDIEGTLTQIEDKKLFWILSETIIP
jgi:hypothetical protein